MAQRVAAAAGLAAVCVLCGCAQQAPPSGGPPDLTPPQIIGFSPDSGQVRVPRNASIRVSFSKRMDHRSVEDYIFTSPPLHFAEVRWNGNELELVPRDSLRAATTYLAVLGTGGRDTHGNALARTANLVFSTGERVSPGRISGRVTAPKQSPAGIFVWLYQDSLHADSSWGRDDPDFVGQTGSDGHFEILGLPLRVRFSAHFFADANRNRSYDEGSEFLLSPAHRIFLTDSLPSDTSLSLRYVDPKLPGSVAGRVDTSLTAPTLAIRLESLSDSTSSQTARPDLRGSFLLRLTPPGKYRIYWFEDANNNQVPDAAETRGEALELSLEPGEDVTEVTLSRSGPPKRPAQKPAE